MVETLVDYIRDLLTRGYDINSVRTYLINSGYDPTQVDQAISAAYAAVQAPSAVPVAQQPAEVKHVIEFSKTTILAILGAVLSVIFLGILGYKLLGTSVPAELLDVNVDALDDEVAPGEDLDFIVNLDNLGAKKRYDVSLKYEVRDVETDQLITLSRETVALETKQSTQAKIKIPSDVKSGEYSLYVTASYQSQSAEASFFFRVIKDEVLQPRAPVPPLSGVEGVPPPGTEITAPIPPSGVGVTPTLQFPTGYTGTDYDNDGIPDSEDPDHDNDDILNSEDDFPFDTDNNGIPNLDDLDDDGDGILDEEDDFPLDSTNTGKTPRYTRPPPRSGPAIETPVDTVCPGDCNDFDICTLDKCVLGTCEYTTVQPCCGNFICEAGETSDFCPDDCAAPPEEAGPSVGETIKEALESAKSSPEKAASLCNSLEKRKDTDNCFDKIAEESGNNLLCDQIKDTSERDTCYMNFAIEFGDFSVCPKVTNRLLKNSCYSLSNLQAAQAAFSINATAPTT